MRSFGIFLLIMGIGSFVLPAMGLQFRIMSLFGSATPIVAIIAIVLGAGLLALSFRNQEE